MTVHHFNTGRLYNAHGQRISYLVEDDGATIHFHDHSRMICGTITRKVVVRKVTPKLVMEFYDRGAYEHTKRADELSMYEGGALVNFDDSGTNDTFLRI